MNTPTHQHINTSTHQHINTSTHQHINTANTSTQQHSNTSTQQHTCDIQNVRKREEIVHAQHSTIWCNDFPKSDYQYSSKTSKHNKKRLQTSEKSRKTLNRSLNYCE